MFRTPLNHRLLPLLLALAGAGPGAWAADLPDIPAGARLQALEIEDCSLTDRGAIQRLLPFQVGQAVTAEALAAALRRWRESGLFESVEASATEGDKPDTIRLTLTVEEKERPRPVDAEAAAVLNLDRLIDDLGWGQSVTLLFDELSPSTFLTKDPSEDPQQVVNLREQIRQAPRDPDLHRQLARALAKGGQAQEAKREWRAAVALYREALQERRREAALHFGLGEALTGLERYEEAIAAYQAALGADPEFYPVYGALLNAYCGRAARRYAPNRLTYFHIDPAHGSRYDVFSLSPGEQKSVGALIAQGEEVFSRLTPEKVTPQAFRSLLDFYNHQFLAALLMPTDKFPTLSQMEEEGLNLLNSLMPGFMCLTDERTLTLARALSQAEPKNTEHRFQFARLLVWAAFWNRIQELDETDWDEPLSMLEDPRLTEALTLLREVEAQAMKQHPSVYWWLGLVLALQGEREAARPYLWKALDADPRNRTLYEAYIVTALLPLFGVSEEESPELLSQRLADLEQRAANPRQENAVVHLALGMVYLACFEDDQRRPLAARRHFARALGLEPDNPEAHYGLGRMQLRGREIDAAVTHLRQAVKGKPNDGEWHYALGVALLAQGKVAEAVREMGWGQG